MLRWTVTFVILAIIAAIFGFGGIAAGAASIAKILFFIFLILFVNRIVSVKWDIRYPFSCVFSKILFHYTIIAKTA